MLWATYKATCRRSGVYAGASGPRDFNADLLEPISKQLATGWERAFLRRLPQVLENFAAVARLHLENFHRRVVEHFKQRGTNHAGISMLSQQLRTHVTRLKEIPGMLRTVIQDLQRDASRGFHPVVTRDMEPGYDACVKERGMFDLHPLVISELTLLTGPGSYARMKTHMIDHVQTQGQGMFVRSTESVKTELQALCERVEQEMRAQVLDIYNLLARDYLAVLVGVEAGNVQALGLRSPERVLRGEMLPILQDAARWFMDPSGGDDNDPVKDESPGQGPSPCGGDDDDDDNDLDNLAATQLHEESEEAGARGRDGVGIKSEPAVW